MNYTLIHKNKHAGFTLIELLVTVFAISILMGIIFTVVDPGKQFADIRNTRRTSDVRTINNAIYQYIIDAGGELPGPGEILEEPQTVCAITGDACAGMLDLGDVLKDGTYVVDWPHDPKCEIEQSTCYTVSFHKNSAKLFVDAPLREIPARTIVTIAGRDVGIPILFFAAAFLGFIIAGFLIIFPKK